MSDNGQAPIAFGRGPTYEVEYGPWRLLCERQTARCYNAWTPILNLWFEEESKALAAAKAREALLTEDRELAFRFHEWPERLVDAVCRLIDPVVLEADGVPLNGTPISARLHPDETGDMLAALWKGSRLTGAERGKSEPPSQ